MTVTPTSSSGNQVKSSNFKLKTEDFIKMMITQLQNQDPLEPAKNEQLLAQMSQIGQLQSTEALQSSLKTLVMQNNLGASSSLIGKEVQGQTPSGDKIGGIVNSVRVEGEDIVLELDNGQNLQLGRVTSIANARLDTSTVVG